MSVFACDPQEVQRVKDALTRNDLNLGIGVLHEPTGRVYLVPMDSLPQCGGHAELVDILKLPQAECKGFGVLKQQGGFVPVNSSHLNGPQGQPGSLRMPADTFDAVVDALRAAGL